jgi:hypothetical protein
MEGLTRGRNVHYVDVKPGQMDGTRGGGHLAAIVTDLPLAEIEDHPGLCTLSVFFPRRINRPACIDFVDAEYCPAETNRAGTWHWIEKA